MVGTKGNERSRRHEEVLEEVISLYISSGEPVGSRVISRRLGLSSATIRNVMQDLEEEGFISQPHTSAGRIPTERGYRYYIDSLMRLKRLTDRQIRAIDTEYRSQMESLNDLLAKTSHLLSRITRCAGVVLLPKTRQGHFKRIDLVALAKNKVLVILITGMGVSKDLIVDLAYRIDQATLERIAAFLNQTFCNLTLDQIRAQLVEAIRREHDSTHRVAVQARDIIDAALAFQREADLYVGGTGTMLEQPEFEDVRRVRALIELLENREGLAHLISDESPAMRTKVLIGRESGVAYLSGMSVVSCGYKMSDDAIGRLGVIGPTRMCYDRVIPMLEFLAGTLTTTIGELED